MDVCDPNINYGNIRQRVQMNVGRPLNLSRKEICDLYTNIQQNKLLLPPLVITKDRTYMYDRKSPFKKKDYEALFKKDTSKSKLKKLGEKCGALMNSKDSSKQIRYAIFTKLRALKVREPIKLSNGCPRPKKTKPVMGMNTPTPTPTFNQNKINNTLTPTNLNQNKINNTLTPTNLNQKINNTLTPTNLNQKINNTYKINSFNTPKISERKTLFAPGFVPNFIKKGERETVNKNYAPVPVAERVSINSGPPVMRAMEAPRVNRNSYAPAPVAQRVSFTKPSGLSKPSNAQVTKIKIEQRKDLQKHLNSLRNLSVEDVDEYVNRLLKNKSSLKDIKKNAETQNELYKKRKEEIRKKLKNFEPQMTLTQKSIYNARLNVIPRGKTRSYLNTIEADLLKNMNSSDMLRKRSAIRKEFINVSANKEAIQKKYQDIANKYTGRNREVLNKVYNSLINIRPKLNTNKNTLTKLQVLSMLNRNKRRSDEQKVANKIRELTKSLNNAARANKENEFNKLAKQIFNQHNTRVKSLEEELSKLKNLSQRVATMKERVELQNNIEKAEEQVVNARNAAQQAETVVVPQFRQRVAKRKRTMSNNSARLQEEGGDEVNQEKMPANAANRRQANAANGGRGVNGQRNAAAAAAAAKAAAAKANVEVKKAKQELELAKTEAAREAARKNLEFKQQQAAEKRQRNLEARKAEEQFRLEAGKAAAQLRANAAEMRKAEQAERNEKRKAEQAERNEKRKAEQAEREARKAENNAQREAKRLKLNEERKAEQAERNEQRRQMQQLANGASVPFQYVARYANRVPGEVNMNSLKNKANKDREVAKLLGKKNVSFIEPAQYNSILESAKKQRFVANRKVNGVSMTYLNSYMKATKANSVDNIDTADFANKFKMDKNLMQKEAVRVGPASKMSRVKGILRRGTGGVEYVPKNTYNNRLQKALTVAENKAQYEAALKADKNFAAVAKQSGADTDYLKAYMQSMNYTNLKQVNLNAFKKKVSEDKQLLANEAALSGKKRMFARQRVSFIANADYTQRFKQVSNAKKERLLVKNIPKAFLNAYRSKTGKSIDNLSENNTELKNLYAKAVELSELSGQPITYPENVNALNTNLARLRKQRNILQKYNISKNFLNAHLKKTSTNINTVNENSLKTAANKAKELSNFLKTPVKYPDDKINNNLAVARKQKEENRATVEKNEAEKRNLAIIKQNIKSANVEKFMKNTGVTAQQLIKNENLMKKLKSENVKQALLQTKVPANVIKRYQEEVSGRNLTKNDVQQVLNYYKKVQIREQQEKGSEKKLQKIRDALTKRAKKVGILNLNVTNVNVAQERVLNAERRKMSEQREKGSEKKLEKTRDALTKRAKKAGLLNLNVTNVNVAQEQVKKAEKIQAVAKKNGVKVNSNFVKGALNLDDTRLKEALIKKKLQAMGVNNAWIAAYKNERKVNTLTNDVFATAQRQLNMLKNEGGKNLVYLKQEEKMTKMNRLYLTTTAKEFAQRYGIDNTQASKDIREAMKQLNEKTKNDTYKLRDPTFKRKVEVKVAEKYKDVLDFARVKKNAKTSIERMSVKFQPGGKLNQSVVNKFLNNLEAANNKTKVDVVLKEAQREYDAMSKKKPTTRKIPVEEVNSNSNSNNNGKNSSALVPYGPRNSPTRRFGYRLGQVTGAVGGALARVKESALPAPPSAPATPPALPAPRQNMRKVLKERAKNNKFVNAKQSFDNDNKSVYSNAQENFPKSGNKRKPENKGARKKRKVETGVFSKKQNTPTPVEVKKQAAKTKKQVGGSFKMPQTRVLTRSGTRSEVKALRRTQGPNTKLKAKVQQKLNEQARLEGTRLKRKPQLRTSK